MKVAFGFDPIIRKRFKITRDTILHSVDFWLNTDPNPGLVIKIGIFAKAAINPNIILGLMVTE
jgi:hypothetical protein